MDDAQYIVLAQSILESENYGFVNPPDKILPTRCPFGWPLILAPVSGLFDGGFMPLKLTALLFTLANSALIAAGWKYLGFSHSLIGLASAGLYAFSPLVVGHARMVMSEPAFLFFVLAGLILTARLAQHLRWRLGSLVLGGVWVFAAYVRAIGLVLVGGSALFLVLKRGWTNLAFAFFGSLLVIALAIGLTPVDHGDLIYSAEYLDQLVDPESWGQRNSENMVLRAAQAAVQYSGRHLGNTLIPFLGGPTTQRLLDRVGLGILPSLVSVSILLLVAGGYLVSVRVGGLLPVHFFAPLYLLVLLVWPWQGDRFLYGILPFLFGFMMMGAWRGVQSLAKFPSKGQSILGPVAVGLLVSLLVVQLMGSLAIGDSLDHVRDFTVGTTWLEENTPPDAVVAAEQPQTVYLYSNRATVGLPPDPLELCDRFPGVPVYVLIAPELKWSDSGALEYTRIALGAQAVLEQSSLADLVFEDGAHLVKVYHLRMDDCASEG
jgi:hypothetical protein